MPAYTKASLNKFLEQNKPILELIAAKPEGINLRIDVYGYASATYMTMFRASITHLRSYDPLLSGINRLQILAHWPANVFRIVGERTLEFVPKSRLVLDRYATTFNIAIGCTLPVKIEDAPKESASADPESASITFSFGSLSWDLEVFNAMCMLKHKGIVTSAIQFSDAPRSDDPIIVIPYPNIIAIDDEDESGSPILVLL